jgi:putative ABC transport system permease protein
MLWKLAWRNLWRHRTRTLIMVSAVALAYGLMLVGLGIGDDSHARMLEEATRAAGGDLLVHGEGYWATRSSDVVIPEGDAVLRTVASVDGVRTALPRVLTSGLMSTSADSRAVLLQGVDPEREPILNDYAGDVIAGDFLGDEGREDPVVLGERLVRRLELELGDRVVLTATGPDGEMTRALFHLTGVIRTGTRELDEMLALTTVGAARTALGGGAFLTQVGILAEPGTDPDTLAARIEDALAARGDGLEVLTWPEAVPEMVGFIELDDAFGYIYMAIIFAVVLFSITNTFLMAVMERVREFGLLNALGLRHGRIGRLLLTETALLTALAMAAGFLLGFGGHLAAEHWGISVASYGIEDLELSGIDMSDLVIHSTINPMKWLVASALVALTTVAAALYPAWRATKLAPAEAMRFYE